MSTMDEANSLEMKMAMAFVKCMSTQWKGFGPSCAVGCVRIGAFPRKLPFYVGFFEFIHDVRKRGKALLGSLIELLVS